MRACEGGLRARSKGCPASDNDIWLNICTCAIVPTLCTMFGINGTRQPRPTMLGIAVAKLSDAIAGTSASHVSESPRNESGLHGVVEDRDTQWQACHVGDRCRYMLNVEQRLHLDRPVGLRRSVIALRAHIGRSIADIDL